MSADPRAKALAYSIVTITHNRDAHLNNVLTGLERQTRPPEQVVVAYMNQTGRPELRSTLPIVTADVSSATPLPLAQARNLGAGLSTTPTLVFLDVDCIPAPDFAEQLLDDLARDKGLVMGTPRYLRANQTVKGADLHAVSTEHPVRSQLRLGRQSDYNLFWSLCFAISTTDFERVGGFDEAFKGYGAEDTDFARSCRQAGVPFCLSGAVVYHQHHGTCHPPLNHFDDVVLSAQVFYSKWKEWPMLGWLEAFTTLGLIEWTATGKSLSVLRAPSEREIASSRITDLST